MRIVIEINRKEAFLYVGMERVCKLTEEELNLYGLTIKC